MIKVLHISTAKTWRGGEQQLAYMIDGLQKKEVENFILTVSNSILHQVYSDKVTCFEQKKSHGFSLKWAKKIKSICVNNKIDIIHCHDSKAHTYAVLSSFLYNNKAPIIVHRKVIFKIKQSFLTKYKYNHTRVKKIICISKAVQNEVKKVLNKDKTTVIYDAKELNQKRSQNLDLKKEFKIKPDNKLIGYVAALTYEKDHETFLKVAKKIVVNNKKVHFIIIGEGKLKEKIQSRIKQLDLQKNVTLTGFIKDAKFLIKQFDVLLFTSMLEGLGTTILDAFEYKVPVVTVKNGGAEELVIPNKTGMICNVKDVMCLTESVEKILLDKQLSKTFTNNAYKYVTENHSATKMVDSLYNLYRNVVNS